MASDPPPLALRGPSPDTVVDVVDHGVLKARLFHWTISADPPRDLHPNAITWEKSVRRHVPALPPPHPRSVHGSIVTCPGQQRYALEDIRS
jgi:hypothetical protein